MSHASHSLSSSTAIFPLSPTPCHLKQENSNRNSREFPRQPAMELWGCSQSSLDTARESQSPNPWSSDCDPNPAQETYFKPGWLAQQSQVLTERIWETKKMRQNALVHITTYIETSAMLPACLHHHSQLDLVYAYFICRRLGPLILRVVSRGNPDETFLADGQ